MPDQKSREDNWRSWNLTTCQTLYRQWKYESAELLARAILDDDPNSTDALLLLGRILHKQAKFTDAEQVLRRCLVSTQDNSIIIPALSGLVYVLGKLGWTDEQIKMYKRWAQIHDSWDAYPWYKLGKFFLEIKHPHDAVEAFQRATSIQNDYAEAWNGLGDAYLEIRALTAQAGTAFQKATKINPDYMLAWWGLGAVLFDLRHYSAAEDAYGRVVFLDPNIPEAWKCLEDSIRVQRISQKEKESKLRKYKLASSKETKSSANEEIRSFENIPEKDQKWAVELAKLIQSFIKDYQFTCWKDARERIALELKSIIRQQVQSLSDVKSVKLRRCDSHVADLVTTLEVPRYEVHWRSEFVRPSFSPQKPLVKRSSTPVKCTGIVQVVSRFFSNGDMLWTEECSACGTTYDKGTCFSSSTSPTNEILTSLMTDSEWEEWAIPLLESNRARLAAFEAERERRVRNAKVMLEKREREKKDQEEKVEKRKQAHIRRKRLNEATQKILSKQISCPHCRSKYKYQKKDFVQKWNPTVVCQNCTKSFIIEEIHQLIQQ